MNSTFDLNINANVNACHKRALRAKIIARFLSAIRSFVYLSAFVCALSSALCDEIKQFDAKPVRISDRFEADTRKDYKTSGNVSWSTLKLTIPKDAVLARVSTIDADFRLGFDLWPTEIKEGEQNVTKI